jgi:hypothetical protein
MYSSHCLILIDMDKNCKNCQKVFEASDYRSVFCGRSCSATYLNKTSPKRRKTKTCKSCSSLISSCRTYCVDCRKSNKHLKHGKSICDMTLGEFEGVSKQIGGNHYSEIRYHSRTVAECLPNVCKCGYNKHVEVCHIHAISDFPKTALISDINSKDNLVKLCPNCHWEFDNGLLKL